MWRKWVTRLETSFSHLCLSVFICVTNLQRRCHTHRRTFPDGICRPHGHARSFVFIRVTNPLLPAIPSHLLAQAAPSTACLVRRRSSSRQRAVM